jgi:hypothetical protein
VSGLQPRMHRRQVFNLHYYATIYYHTHKKRAKVVITRLLPFYTDVEKYFFLELKGKVYFCNEILKQ